MEMVFLPQSSAEVAVQGGPSVAEKRHAALGHCLIASGNLAHRKLLAQTANQYGWDAIVCDNAEDAQRSLQQAFPQLAFIDVQGVEGEAFRGLVEDIASECQTLLVVCGNEDDLGEEIWARQLGVWFYLPGLRDGASLGLLFRDARTIVEARAAKANAASRSVAADRASRRARRPGMTALGRRLMPGRERGFDY